MFLNLNNKVIYFVLHIECVHIFSISFQVNIFRKCPFESDAIGKCGSKSCAVDECKPVSFYLSVVSIMFSC